MPESLLHNQWLYRNWVPTALQRRSNVAKYEALTGRLIWWRDFQMGASTIKGADRTPGIGAGYDTREIVPIHGTEDVAVVMRGSYFDEDGDPQPTDYLFRVHACGSLCDSWVISTAEDYSHEEIPWLTGYNRVRESMFGGANGTTYLTAVGAYWDLNLPGYVSQPFTRGYSPDGVVNFGSGLNGPLKGIPGTSDILLRGAPGGAVIGPAEPNILIPIRPLHRVGPGSNWQRPFWPPAAAICANASGHVLLSFSTIRPIGAGLADAFGCVVTTGSGAPVTVAGYSYDFRIEVTPTTVTIHDNSLIAFNYDSHNLGHNATVDPNVCVPVVGVSHGNRWYVNGQLGLGLGGNSNIFCLNSSLGEIWRKTMPGVGGANFTSCAYQMLADDDGIYVVAPHTFNGTMCALTKLDHDGNVIYGLNSAGAVSACLSHDGKYLYTTG